MKLSTINTIAGILSGMKLNKISDKKAKSALLKNYLALRKALKQAQEDQQEIVRKFQDDWKDELAEVEAFRKEDKPVVGHEDYLDAEVDANKAIRDIFEQEVDLTLSPVKMDVFVDEELTLEQLALLEENGFIE